VIEDVLKERVSQGLDGVRLFATIFFRRVRALALHRSKMWDHAHGESLEQLQYPGAHGDELWGWQDGMIQTGTRCSIAGPSPFWKDAPRVW